MPSHKQWIGVLLAFASAAPFSVCSSAQAAHPAKAVRGSAENGEALYKRYCGMCHSTEAGVKIVGPSLHGDMKGAHAKTVAQVREQTLVGKGLMPSFKNRLNDQEIADLIAYIRKL